MRALSRVFRGRDLGQAKPLAKIISDLWKNGEQGVLYDVEGFREAWNSVGPELLPEGNFDSPIGWTNLGGAGWIVSGGKASVNNTSGSTFRLNRIIYPPVNAWYTIQLVVTSISSGNIQIQFGNRTVIGVASTPGTYTWVFRRLDSYSFYLDAINGTVAEVDSVSIKEWTGYTNCILYQDAAGSTPAYLPGSGQVDPPVGLLLDKRLGLLRGPEKLSNGDFSAGSTGWNTSGADSTHILTFNGGTLRYQSDTTSPVLLVSQNGSMTPGRWYEITTTISSWVSGSIKSDAFAQTSLVLASGVGVYKVTGLCTSGSFSFSRNTTNVDLTIDSISIKEVLGNHAYQTTTTSRPVLSARYNRSTSTEDFSATTPWPDTVLGVGSIPIRTANAGLAPNNTFTATRLQFNLNGGTALGDVSGITQGTSITGTFDVGSSVIVSIWLKTFDGTSKLVRLNANGLGGNVYTVTGDWQKFTFSWVVDVATRNPITLRLRGSEGTSNTADLLVWGADIRVANDGVNLPSYQSVLNANTYDTIGFPLYLKFDGVDDGLMTPNIDFSGTSIAAAVSVVRKMADGTRGIIFELGGTGYGSPGSFNQEIYWFAANVSTSYSGTTGNATSTYPCTAPISVAMSSSWDLTTPLQVLRVNGVQRSSATAASGGTFINAPLFIGRRNNSAVPGNIRLYSLLIRGVATSTPLIAKIERYLNQKAKVY